jgi:hypothetical protein
MAANNDPIFSRVGDVTSNGTTGMAPTLTTAAADYTGVSASNSLVFTADATNGSFLQRLRMKAVSSNVVSVARVYINNGSTNATAANNSFYGEITLPAIAATAIASTPDVDYPMNIALPPGFRIYVGLGTTVAGGWVVTPVAGKY